MTAAPIDSRPLAVVLVEDNEADAELIAHAVERRQVLHRDQQQEWNEDEP